MNTVDENRVAKKKQSGKIRKKGQIDWMITLLPLGLIAALSILFFLLPEQSNTVLAKVRFFLGDTFGVYYLAIGLGVFLLSLYLAFSKYGDIVLGEQDEKPKYSFFAWGSMMFTCGLAADILFYSFAEWVMYAADPQIEKMGGIQEWAGVYPLFHWSLIPWGFYLVLAAAFGFMLHVRKRNRQRYSEACRPIMGKQTDGIGGRLIDLLAVFALLAGTATTFSVATPLMASAINAKVTKYLGRETVIGDALTLPWDIANDANIDKYGIQGVKRRIGMDIYGNLIVMFAGAKIGGIKGGSIGIFSVLGLTEIKEAIAPPLIENERKQADDSYLREINSNVID